MIEIKSRKEIEIMREGGKILAEIMAVLEKKILPDTPASFLNDLAEKLILEKGGKPAFKGYQGFPATLCVSLNEEIVHGLPLKDKIIKESDLVSLDLGLFWKGYYLDMAITKAVGEISFEAKRLIRVVKKALKIAIKNIKEGNTIGDIGNAIERYISSQGFSVIRDLCGHGIGTRLHQDPQVLNYGKRHSGPKLKRGMVVCPEPMASLGDYRIVKGKDGFTYKTKDNSLAVHFEHTVALTEKGAEVLTTI